MYLINSDGTKEEISVSRLKTSLSMLANNLNGIDLTLIVDDVLNNIFSGISIKEFYTTIVITCCAYIEQEPDYSTLAARLMSKRIDTEVMETLKINNLQNGFETYLEYGIANERLYPKLNRFDIKRLSDLLISQPIDSMTYLGIKTLYDRYLLTTNGQCFETPQYMLMRVAMGLSLNETDYNERACEFYKILSNFDFMSSTPTLFNAGTLRPQLSSCYLTTVPDDLSEIFMAYHNNALLSKHAGGLGNDWTPVRALGSFIKGTNGASQGVIPFLKINSDTAVAANQSGKRKGAFCAFLETWHLDFEDFLELRKNTGDDRRRTHDMNTSNWIPDLFMERVMEEGTWTLFSPSDVPDLHDMYGEAFNARYKHYERMIQKSDSKIKLYKTVNAVDLWRKMLSMLFETGHPWITFKDPCNIRYTNKHVGQVHSSNLCTEITLHTNEKEIAVCNLGSINLVNHVSNTGSILVDKLKTTIKTAVRMLDNVIDINYYPLEQAKNSNMKHRPVGLGIMGFHDMLYIMKIPYSSDKAVAISDYVMELVSYYAIEASMELAKERGQYSTFKGSLWSKGILPIDSLKLSGQARKPGHFDFNYNQTLDWSSLRNQVITNGMRNSNVMAIAPTATISNICGVSQSIDPTYQNLYVKSNLSGEFTVINPYLVKELKKLDMWNPQMVNDLKNSNGSIQDITRIPQNIKELFKTAFEIAPKWVILSGARRQKWLDQAQSLNVYVQNASGKLLDSIYKMAWISGLKTTYYLRATSASSVEKSTSNSGVLNTVSSAIVIQTPAVCSIDNPDCEACQ